MSGTTLWRSSGFGLGQLLFLIFVNNLPERLEIYLVYVNNLLERLETYLRMFMDDGKVIRQLRNDGDCDNVQRDLERFIFGHG